MSQTPEQSEPVAAAGARPVRWVGLARGLALFFAGVFLLNLAAQLRLAEFDYDPNHWWLSFRPLPKVIEQFASIGVAILFIAYGVAPVMAAWRRRATRTAVELLWVLTAWNVINFYGALARGVFRTSFPVPFALFIAAGLLAVWLAAGVERPARGAGQWAIIVGTIALAAVIFPLLQLLTFGLLDHRGASPRGFGVVAVFPDEHAGASNLAGRVKTTADLFRRGGVVGVFAPGGVREVRYALVAQGVPETGIELGQPLPPADGLRGAVREVTAMVPKDQLRVYAVAGFDQLPRLDVLFAQEGRTAYPVPVVRGSGATPGTLLGEVGRLWKCYLSAVTR